MLEATALAQIIFVSRWLVEMLREHGPAVAQPVRDHDHVLMGRAWDEIRDFLASHYMGNTRLDTPFWRHSWQHTDLGEFGVLLDRYREVGPSRKC